jgi:DNA-binding beta-propeller fold protein YncE
MQGQMRLHLALLAALAAAWSLPAAAKDVYYFLGYEVVQVIDGDTDQVVASIPVHGWLRESDFRRDKTAMYVTANRHVVHEVNLGANKVVASLDVNGDGWERFIFGFCLAADEKTAYAGMMSRRTDGGEVVIGKPVVAQISLETGKILRSVEVPWGVAQLVPVKGRQALYAIGKDLIKIDVSGKEMKLTGTVPMFEKKQNILPLWNYAWESGGAFVAHYYTPEIMGLITIDESSGEVTDIPLKGDPVFAYSVIFSPDRKKVYAVMDDLSVIDVARKTYGPVAHIKEGTSYAVNVSSDGKKVYVGAGGSSVTVYDAETLEPLKVIKMASDAMDLRRVAF